MKPDAWRVLEEPVVEPVGLAEARQQVGLMDDQTEFDRLLLRAMSTARRFIERRLGMTMVATRFRASWLARPAGLVLSLPNPPLLVDASHPLAVSVDGQLLDSSRYVVDADSLPGSVTLATMPDGRVAVEYWGGVPAAGEVCPMLRSAILAYVTHAFENRGVVADGSAVELPQAFDSLLAASSWSGTW